MTVGTLFSARAMERLLLGFLLFSVLWRGGKALDATWLLVAVAGMLAFWFWWPRGRAQKDDPVPTSVWLTGIALLLWTLGSFAFSSTQNYGLDEVLRDGSLFLLFLWTARAAAGADGEEFTRRFRTVLSAAVLIACLVGLAVYALQPVSRFVGTFFDERFHVDYWPNAWAEFLLLGWPVLALQLKRYGWWGAGLTGFVLGCLFLSYSRGAFLCFVGQIGIMGLLYGIDLLCRRVVPTMAPALRSVGMILLAVLVSVGVFVGMNAVRSGLYDVESVAEKVTFTASEGTSSVDERRQFWGQALELSMERPFLGWGPYSFRFIQPRLQTQVFATSDHPHNVFLKLAMERGWPAAILFLVLLLCILLPSAWRRTMDSGDWTGRILLVAVAGGMAHNLIDYNLQFVGIALPLWMMLGLLTVRGRRTVPPIKVRMLLEVLLAMALLITAVWEGRYLVLSSLGRRAEAAGDAEAALAWYRQAEGEIFSRDMHLGRASLLAGQQKWDEADGALGQYFRQNAEDARAWLFRADLEAQRGNGTGAFTSYEQAATLGIYNYPGIATGLLEMLRDRPAADLAARLPLLQTVFRAYADAILRNAHFIALSGAVEEFEGFGLLLQELHPAEAPYYREMMEKVLDHADTERSRLGGRQRGILW